MPQDAIGKSENLELSAPVKFNDEHDFSDFDCGERSINEYAMRARKAQLAKDAVVYVVTTKGTARVVAFYTLTNGSVVRAEAPKAMQRNAPAQYPVIVLGRLGLDKSIQARGVAKALLRDAIERSLQAAEIVGSRAMLVHALDPRLAMFYQRTAGFVPSPLSPMTLMLALK